MNNTIVFNKSNDIKLTKGTVNSQINKLLLDPTFNCIDIKHSKIIQRTFLKVTMVKRRKKGGGGKRIECFVTTPGYNVTG
jgi:hypothetical protein